MTPETAAAILNVPVTASRDEILSAYTRRARMTHPDRFAGAPDADVKAATAEFIRVTEARDTLLVTVPTAEPEPERPAPPAADVLSFEEFVAYRDANAWTTSAAPQAPRAQPAPAGAPVPAPRKRRTTSCGWLYVSRSSRSSS